MNLSDFCRYLWTDSQAESILAPYWEELQRHCGGSCDFLSEEFVKRYGSLCSLPEGYLAELERVAARAAGDPVLSAWAAMLHYGIYAAASPLPLDKLPGVEKVLGEDAGLFQLLVTISALSLIEAVHRKLGLPEDMLAAGAASIGTGCRQYESSHGGLRGSTMGGGWLRKQVTGRLFRIGRLEYLMQTYQIELPAVYVEKSTGRPQALCRDGWKFNREGLRISVCEDKVCHTTAMTFENNCVIGTPVNVLGKVLFGEQIRLNLDQWEPLASAWDIVPSIHIPAGGGMTFEAVRDSLLRARDFFRDCLHLEVRAFGCSSWILNPALERELPDSNFASLQRNVYLLVPELAPDSGLVQAYGRKDADPLKEPCRTGLHRAFRNIFQRKEQLCWGGMIILTRDIDQYGTEYYRRNFL